MQISKIKDYIFKKYEEVLLPSLMEYIRIPNQSPEFEPDWEAKGNAEKATIHVVNFLKNLGLKDIKVEIIKEEKRTHLIYAEIPATQPTDHSILFYAHIDKQPPLDESKWTLGKPYDPKIIDGKLYGRGASDDGYGPLSIALAIRALEEAGIPHGRCVLAFESSEESGDEDVVHYLKKLKERIGKLDLIVCMDAGCGDYCHVWNTVSLRGVINLWLKVRYLNEGVHSGQNGGIVADSFNICRIILDRLENPKTGEMIKDLYVEVNSERMAQLKKASEAIGDGIHTKMPFVTGAKHMCKKDDNLELLLNNTWRPALAITGIDGIPDLQNAGNVLRPETTLKLSIRIPPSLDTKKAEEAIKSTLLKEAPFGAEVTVSIKSVGTGFLCPDNPKWLEASLEESSQFFYKKEALSFGDGASIPLMGMLSEMYPGTPFWVTGLLGPMTNAHSVNEMLPIEFNKNLVCVIGKVIADHYGNIPH